MFFENLCAWIVDTPLSEFVKTHAVITPAVQSIHILAVSIVLAGMAMLDLRMMNLAGKHHPVSSMAARFIPAMWWSLLVLACSGIILIFGEPERELLNVGFRTKMVLVVVAALITLYIQKALKRDPDFWSAPISRQNLARLVGIVSLTLWITIAVLGRWIAYIQQVGG